MAKVKFTSAVEERFGGAYTTPDFTARKGEVWLVDDRYTEQISRDHCGLPKDKDGKPQKDLIKVIDKNAQPSEGMRAEMFGEPAVEAS